MRKRYDQNSKMATDDILHILHTRQTNNDLVQVLTTVKMVWFTMPIWSNHPFL